MGFFTTVEGDIIDGGNDILSQRELAFTLDVSRSTIRRWAREGMPRIAFSNNIGYNLLDVQDWLERVKQLPSSDLVRRWEQARKTLKKLQP
jgi:transcriptional regulator with XRE-family HTH domain